MTARPILCQPSVVRNIIEGRQTQDRRPLSHPLTKCKPGDLLWVRETFALTSIAPMVETIENPIPVYAVEDSRSDYGGPWRPSIHMPRWASRITLEVVEVRRQRLWDMAVSDAYAEGVVQVRDACHVIRGHGYDLVGLCHTSPITPFAILWDELYGHKTGQSWNDNPEVAAITFKTHMINIDKMEV